MSAPHKCAEFARCADCGLPYSDDGWADFVVADAVWAILTRDDGATLLCAVCMTRRAARVGITTQDAAFTSGPFARDDWKKPDGAHPDNSELFEALVALDEGEALGFLTRLDAPGSGHFRRAVEKARAAIAKAVPQ